MRRGTYIVFIFTFLITLLTLSSNLFGMRSRKHNLEKIPNEAEQENSKLFSPQDILPNDCLHCILCFLPWKVVIDLTYLNHKWNEFIFGKGKHFRTNNLRIKNRPCLKINKASTHYKIRLLYKQRIWRKCSLSRCGKWSLEIQEQNLDNLSFVNLINLQKLELRSCHRVNWASFLTYCKNLEELVIIGEYDEDDMPYLDNLSFENLINLQKLELRRCSGVNWTSILTYCKNLEEIGIQEYIFYKAERGNASFEKLTNLKKLKFRKCWGGKFDLILTYCKNLEELVIIGEYDEDDMPYLDNLSFENLINLQKLELRRCRGVNEKAMELLRQKGCEVIIDNS